MKGPGKNRLHGYEAGWLTLLLEMGVAEERDLLAAQARLAQQAIEEMTEQKQRRQRKRRPGGPEAP